MAHPAARSQPLVEGTGPVAVWRIVRASSGLGWLLPAMFLSVMSTGMTAVALAWLVLTIAPAGRGGLWVAAILLATYVPGLVASAFLHRRLAHWTGASLVVLDAVARAAFMALIGALAAASLLTPLLTVVLVVGAAVTSAWGRGGMQAVVAELVPPAHRLAVNSWAMSQAAVAMVVGPAVGGVAAGVIHPFVVLLADAALRLAIAAILGLRVRSALGAGARPVPGSRGPARHGWRILMTHPDLRAVLALTFGVAFCYGIFQVALPLLVVAETGGGAQLLGAAWAAFGVGSAAGAFLSRLHRGLTVWQSAVITTFLWGASVALVGATHVASITLVGMLAGGLVYAPYQAVVTTFIQQSIEKRDLVAVGTAWSAVLMVAQPLGYLAAGPVTLLTPARTLVLAAAAATVGVGFLAMLVRPLRVARPLPASATSSAGG